MPMLDNDSAIRDRAYLLWESAGWPSGMEHQHWAEARRQIEAETALASPVVTLKSVVVEKTSDDCPPDIVRLREALYTPEPFSFELFGAECPPIDCPVIIQHAV